MLLECPVRGSLPGCFTFHGHLQINFSVSQNTSYNSDWQAVKIPRELYEIKGIILQEPLGSTCIPKENTTLQKEENGDPKRGNSRSACDLETPEIDLTEGGKPCSGGTIRDDKRSFEPWWSILSQLAALRSLNVPSGGHSLATLPLMADSRSVSQCFKTQDITSLILGTFCD